MNWELYNDVSLINCEPLHLVRRSPPQNETFVGSKPLIYFHKNKTSKKCHCFCEVRYKTLKPVNIRNPDTFKNQTFETIKNADGVLQIKQILCVLNNEKTSSANVHCTNSFYSSELDLKMFRMFEQRCMDFSLKTLSETGIKVVDYEAYNCHRIKMNTFSSNWFIEYQKGHKSINYLRNWLDGKNQYQSKLTNHITQLHKIIFLNSYSHNFIYFRVSNLSVSSDNLYHDLFTCCVNCEGIFSNVALFMFYLLVCFCGFSACFCVFKTERFFLDHYPCFASKVYTTLSTQRATNREIDQLST